MAGEYLKMKILIVSQDIWAYKSNAGNVLINLFEGFDAEFAQIYCSPGTPDNNICENYFQITDIMMINQILKRRQVGKAFRKESIALNNNIQEISKSRFYNFFRRYHFEIFDIIREIVWKVGKWKNNSLRDFVKDFNPDILFVQCCGQIYMSQIALQVHSWSGAKLVTYISDDYYSLRQFNLSPLYWINRLFVRKKLGRLLKESNLIYSMSDDQIKELSSELNVNMKILRKGAEINTILQPKYYGKILQIVYAGNLFYGRMSTLQYICKVLQKINHDTVQVQLNIYTNSILTSSAESKLDDNRSVFLNKAVNSAGLHEIYANSDIVLHVESFNFKEKLLTRLSFSTKIVECLASSCVLMALTWDQHSGYKYLTENKAAICLSDLSLFEDTILNVLSDRTILNVIREQGYRCLEKNHDIFKIRDMLKNDFNKIMTEN